MSILAKPVAPGFARQAQAAVVMNATDMTAINRNMTPQSNDAGRAATTLGQLLQAASQKAAT
jgi:hypothetical protein